MYGTRRGANLNEQRTRSFLARPRYRYRSSIIVFYSILDNHLARVWSDKTPRRSPSQGATPIRPKSPDGRKVWPAAAVISTATAVPPARLPHSYVTGSGGGGVKKKDKDVCSLFSSDSGNGTDPAEGIERRHRGSGANLVKSKSMPEQNESHTSEYSSGIDHLFLFRFVSFFFFSSFLTRNYRRRAGTFLGAAYYPPRGVGKAWSGSRRTLTDSGVSVISGSRADNITPQSPQCKEKYVFHQRLWASR